MRAKLKVMESLLFTLLLSLPYVIARPKHLILWIGDDTPRKKTTLTNGIKQKTAPKNSYLK